jgi:hypothetical protein
MNWLIPLLVPVLVPIFMAFISKLFPYKMPRGLVLPDENVLTEKYAKLENHSGWYTLISLAVGAFIYGFVLSLLNQSFIDRSKLILFQILPGDFFYYIFGFMLGLGTLGYIMIVILKIRLGKDYDEYEAYSNLKTGRDSVKAYNAIALPCAFMSILGFCLLWNYGVKLYKDKIEAHWFLSLTDKTYTYNQVRSISFINDNAPHYHIILNDGTDWNTQTGLNGGTEQPSIINFIHERSGIKIDTLLHEPK